MKGVVEHLDRVTALEHEADTLSRAAVGRLFRDGVEPLEVIKWRDIYQGLEEAIDAAEDAAEDRADAPQGKLIRARRSLRRGGGTRTPRRGRCG